MSIMPLVGKALGDQIGGMEFIALILVGLYLFALVRTMRTERAREIPQSHYEPPRNAHESWERAVWGL